MVCHVIGSLHAIACRDPMMLRSDRPTECRVTSFCLSAITLDKLPPDRFDLLNMPLAKHALIFGVCGEKCFHGSKIATAEGCRIRTHDFLAIIFDGHRHSLRGD